MSASFHHSSSSSSPEIRPHITRRRGTFQSLNKSLGRLSLSNLNIKLFSLQIPRRRRRPTPHSPFNPSTINFSDTDKEASKSEDEDVINLPYDVIFIIADLLYQPDLLSLCLTCKTLHELLLPVLYHTVILRSSRSCVSFLNLLANEPSPFSDKSESESESESESKSSRLCGYIRELAVRPNYYLAWPEPEGPESLLSNNTNNNTTNNNNADETWVADKLIELAPKMIKLDTFDWDGCEMPKDELWVALRANCGELKTVYSNVGYRDLDPDSALFSFSNLLAFSLTVRHGLTTANNNTTLLNLNPFNNEFTSLEPLPQRLWDMLLQRCPDLEEMALCSFSSSVRNFDVRPLFVPLQETTTALALTLGTFGYTEDFTLTPPMSSSPSSLGTFLEDHRELRYLRLSWNFRRWMSPAEVPIYFDDANGGGILPNLTTFSGIFQHLRSLPPPSLANIHTLDLTCEPIYEDRVDALCGVLKGLRGLRELDVWVHLDFILIPSYELLFRKILSNCRSVEDLHWMSTTPLGPGPQPLLSLARTLGIMMKGLKTFSLTKGHCYRDDWGMLRSALTILEVCEWYGVELDQVNVRWAREKCPNHLKQEGVYDIVRERNRGERVGEGGGEGEIVGVDVFERGITMPGGVFKRRYRYKCGYVYKDKDKERDGDGALSRAQSSARKENLKGKGKRKEGEEEKKEKKNSKRGKDKGKAREVEVGSGQDVSEGKGKGNRNGNGNGRKASGLSNPMKRMSRRFSSFISPSSMTSSEGVDDHEEAEVSNSEEVDVDVDKGSMAM
ncbi:hypothetical protein K435DRAFT_651502 [Dendrothele bispora CBS 962.96]|uniref:F-box domain-containing protein n=1 Tax=Dendrothele bispora (strain CBS 962.96) TaxID=1314807 RepID=A0A4S8MKQ5_DENBC|nr:hypothetical protein K435DRAFT_651502 [Dendrothele bispora CBS 962.96]